MKKLLSTLLLGAALSFPMFASAELKIAVVSVESVFTAMPQAKEAFDNLQKEFDNKAKELDKEKANIEKIAIRLQKEALTMSATDKQKLVTQIQDFEKKVQGMNQEFEERNYQERYKLYAMIGKAINEVAEQKGYDLVITDNAIGYVSSKVDDMTDTVLETVKKTDKND